MQWADALAEVDSDVDKADGSVKLKNFKRLNPEREQTVQVVRPPRSGAVRWKCVR